MKKCLYVLLFVICCTVKGLFAQTTRMLPELFEVYNRIEPAGTLFIHYDKTIYLNNEDVWFAAHLIHADSGMVRRQNLLSIVLSSEDKKISSQHKYPIYNGHGNGAFTIPDSIAPGNYTLTAYTNQLNAEGKPLFVFVQNITVKAAPGRDFTFLVNRNEAKTAQNNGAQFLVQINEAASPSAGRPGKYIVTYRLDDGPPKNSVADAAGIYELNIPADELDVSRMLVVEVRYLKQTRSIKLPLAGYKKSTGVVRFFPEGGNLASGVLNYVAWEVKGQLGAPLKVTGLLYQDEKVLDTLTTGNNGMGKFWLLPKQGSNYTFKVRSPGFTDTTYALPAPIASLPAMHLANGIADDTLLVQMRTAVPANLKLIVHNYHHVYADVPVLAKEINNVKIALSALPKGIAAITILDAMNRPLAERLFFAHYNKKSNAYLVTDKASYKKRGLVTVDIDIPGDKLAMQDSAHVSVACVREDRLESFKLQDIESYTYLNREIDEYQPVIAAHDFYNKQALENILLVKGWRRYRWSNLATAGSVDTTALKSALITGVVSYFGKAIKKAALVRVSQGEKDVILSTDKTGNFALNGEDLITHTDKPVNIAAYGGRYLRLTISDPYKGLNAAMVAALPEVIRFDSSGISSNTFAINGPQNTRMLNTVVIKSTRIGSIDFPLREEKLGINKCGDYLCIANCLNCPFPDHCKVTFIPIKGHVYQKHVVENGVIVLNPFVVYNGCSMEDKPENYINLEGLRIGKEFYPIDSTAIKGLQPLYQTTLYWNPAVVISKGGKARISFNTGDVDGNYQLIVQGVKDNDPVYIDKRITVEAK